MTNSQKNYLVVTPVKNEGVNLPDLIRSIASQTLKPVLWVIVDDGSTDNTPDIIREAKKNYDWIESIQMNSDKRDLGLHLAKVVRTGFDFAIEHCNKNGIDYEYLANVDGDLTLDRTFFENLIKEFERDPELGVVSGGIKLPVGDQMVHIEGLPEDEPSGGDMLIKRECYEKCGGIPVSYSWDSVLKAKARLRGWKTRRFEENIATEIRGVSSAEGYWKGYMHKGTGAHYLNLHPFHVFVKTVIYLLHRRGKEPWYVGIAYLAGYLGSVMKRKEQVDDEEVRKYFWNKWKNINKLRLFKLRDQ